MTTYVAVTQPVGQQQLVSMQPAPVTFSTVNPQPRSGAWKGILWTGIIQVVLGSLTTILGIVTLTVFGPVYLYLDVGSPVWCGILFYVVAGILGTLSGCKKSSVVEKRVFIRALQERQSFSVDVFYRSTIRSGTSEYRHLLGLCGL
ncbi:uncharacterized protein LOC119730144 [Patiria miniata]|uniref:Uncharacterized protein n=1 Tax=Patiria miniata TaxID=46514 RepID=A0A914A549_PATMI|nr:uncharacterized protein LOC119730144 [Patiria miniata]